MEREFLFNKNNGVRSSDQVGEGSPESGSLYSDDLPSGYNSGEQYDTLSTGYMSGEAYELPETRLDIHEPTLGDVTEEDDLRQNSYSSSSNDEKNDETGTLRNVVMEPDIHVRSPTAYGSIKNKLRKKVTSFANPISDNVHEGESSDAGLGHYKAVPSDTDTSAFDSDAPHKIIVSDSMTTDSGAELLGHHRVNKKHGKKSKKNKTKIRDEEWFIQNDNKIWSSARIICFWGLIFTIVFSIGIAAIVIALSPTVCTPPTKWYQGTVLMDIHPNNGYINVSDLIKFQIPTLKKLGIQSIHLKNLTKGSTNIDSISSLLDESLIHNLTSELHNNNMTLLVHVHVQDDQDGISSNVISLDLEHKVATVIKFWAEKGVDGLYLSGLEIYGNDPWMESCIKDWKFVFDKYGTSPNEHILMTDFSLAEKLMPNISLLQQFHLLDANFDLTSNLSDFTLTSFSQWVSFDGAPWINWNVNYDNWTEALLSFHFLLPGTITLKSSVLEYYKNSVKSLVDLRTSAVPIYMNANYKKCHCSEGITKEINFVYHRRNANDLIQMERFYNRHHRYILMGNLGNDSQKLIEIGNTYAGGHIVMDSSHNYTLGQYNFFNDISLHPGHAIVIKLSK